MGLFNKIDPNQISNFDFLAYVTPQMFHCVGDGVTDDTNNLTACLNSRKPVLLVGKFLITSEITVSGPLCLHGAGAGVSEILLGSTSAVITINLGTPGSPVGSPAQCIIRDVSLTPVVAGVALALSITGGAATGSSEPQFYLQNVRILPSATSSYCINGISLSDVRNGSLIGVCVFGEYSDPPNGYGVRFTSTASASAPVDLHMTSCEISWFNYGLLCQPEGATSGQTDWEGITVNDCTFLACQYGVYATSDDNTSDRLSIIGSYINHGAVGVYTSNVQRVFIQNCYFHSNYNIAGGSTQSLGLYNAMTNGVSCYGQFTNNFFNFSNATGYVTRKGIYSHVSSGASYNVIGGNQSLSATTAIDTDATQVYNNYSN